MTYDFESITFISDESVSWDTVIIEENFISIHASTAHLLDLSEIKSRRGFIEINKEERQPF